MTASRILRSVSLLGMLLLTAGCQTAVGNYFANRARDLGDCFMVQAGAGLGLGFDVKAAGLVHIGGPILMYGPTATLGWTYGLAHPIGAAFSMMDEMPFSGGDAGSVIFFHRSYGTYRCTFVTHQCHSILPAVLSFVGDPEDRLTWLWSPENSEIKVPARLHSFDIEVGVLILAVGARVGFSPGEFLDFLLGWIGVDIAGDDVGWGESEDVPGGPSETADEAGE